MIKKIFTIIIILFGFFVIFKMYNFYTRFVQENQILKKVISRLEADSRIAEVLVTEVKYDEDTGKNFTTIKFLEYGADNEPLKPRYFTFSGNIIQFQTLVIRFKDFYVRKQDDLRGKSAYLFWKVFMLDGPDTQEYIITHTNTVPTGYMVADEASEFERRLWRKFWTYALDPQEASKMGIKNAQIEAPGTAFVPGTFYTIKIEHDGGIRIDAYPLPKILRGEMIPN